MGLTSSTSATTGEVSWNHSESLNTLLATTTTKRPDQTSPAMSSPWELSAPTAMTRAS